MKILTDPALLFYVSSLYKIYATLVYYPATWGKAESAGDKV
jgi:hypothetical protein